MLTEKVCATGAIGAVIAHRVKVANKLQQPRYVIFPDSQGHY